MLRGLGFAYHIKGTGGAPPENVDIRFEADGTVVADHRHADDRPGPRDDLSADPRRPPRRAERADPPAPGRHRPDPRMAAATAARARPIWAAPRSGAPPSRSSRRAARSPPRRSKRPRRDIGFADGDFAVAGTDRRIGLPRVAQIARDAGTPLDTYYAWTREWMTFPNGTHVAEVEIDPETGAVRARALRRGRRLRRPGQPDGRRGPGARRDRPGRRARRCWSSRLRRRLRPADRRLASWTTRCRAPTTCRPSRSASTRPAAPPTRSGVKGCGEAGAVAAFPAIGNAIRDALRPRRRRLHRPRDPRAHLAGDAPVSWVIRRIPGPAAAGQRDPVPGGGCGASARSSMP